MPATIPKPDVLVRLWNPRLDDWHEHFAGVAGEIVGRTPEGRATVEVLAMNDPLRVELRAELAADGLWP